MSEPAMLLQRPASNPCQEAAHLLIDVFRDLYVDEKIDEETVRHLTASKRGNRSYHDKYVEKLQSVQNEWQETITTNSNLVDHINEAQQKARISEQRHEQIEKDKYENYAELGLPPVESHLGKFLDVELLQSQHLITPTILIGNNDDRLERQTPSETESIPRYADLTKSSRMLFEKTELEDNYLPEPDHILPKNTSHGNVRPKSKKKTEAQEQKSKDEKNMWRNFTNPYQREIDKKDIANLQRRADFLKNPRFADDLSENGEIEFFRASPSPVIFKSYEIGSTYELKLELKNISGSSRQVRVQRPSTKYFSIDSGKFPDENGLVAPGMSCFYTISFTPDSLADFDDSLNVKTQALDPLIVPLQGRRNPPSLNLPSKLDCGHSLVGNLKTITLDVINTGGNGRFCLQLKESKPEQSIMWDEIDFENPEMLECFPFSVFPDRFQLNENKSVQLKVTFEAKAVKYFSANIKLLCDNCSVQYYNIEGCGEVAQCKLSSVDGGLRMPLLGETFDEKSPQIIEFSRATPDNIYTKEIVITNTCNVPLEFHWSFAQPNLNGMISDNYSNALTSNVFQIKPKKGVLEEKSDCSFELSFSPKTLGDFFEIANFLLDNIPVYVSDNKFIFEDKQMISFSVKAHAEQNEIDISPSMIIIPGKCFIGLSYEKLFTVTNKSTSNVAVQMKNIRTDKFMMTVLPATFNLGANQRQVVSLMITGYKEGVIEEFVPCNIPYTFCQYGVHITANFIGPDLRFDENLVDFGLIRLGCYGNNCTSLANQSSIPADWCVKVHDAEYAEYFEFFPNEGTLYADDKQPIAIHFRSVEECVIDTFLECLIDGKLACCIPVHVEVQRPFVCLECCTLDIIDCCFVGVPITRNITLVNSSLLETKFIWRNEIVTNDKITADIVDVSFHLQDGDIKGKETFQVSVEFCFAKVGVTSFMMVCDVDEMKQPLVLSVNAQVKGLNVDIHIPSISQSESPTQKEEILDFGENVSLGEAVTRRFLLENKTAITTHFHLCPKHFSAAIVDDLQDLPEGFFKMDEFSSGGLTQQQKNKDIQEKLLSNGNGVAFVLSQYDGTLNAYEAKEIHVTVISDMWGEYFDELICQIGDLPVRHIPMHIDVIGSPLSFQMSKEQPPVVRFGMHVCGGNEISRNMKINNSSHKEIRLDWHTFVLDGDDQQLIDLDVYIGEPFPPCINHDDDKHVLDKMSDMKLFTVVLNEHQGKRCSIPFHIPNKQMVVCGKGSANIQVVFKPVYEGVKEKHFLGYALGYMSLQNQDREGDDGTFIRADGLNMFPFALNMTGSVKPAKVYLEACNESGFNFELSATNLLKAAKQINVADCQRDDCLCYSNRYVLVNKTDVLIQFKCLVEKPFTVHVHHDKQVNNKKKTKKDNSLISLKSRKNLEFHITFDLDASLLQNIVDNIEEELIIKKPFIIEFTNKSRQEYELTAIIKFPIMQLSTSEVDFGVCHVGEMRELSLCIHNPSKADLFWRAEIDKNCPKACIDAFAIQSTSGKISNAWSSQHKDSYVDVKIQFTAAHNVEYEAIMEITSLFHEEFLKISPMKVFLRGIGSYDEATKVK